MQKIANIKTKAFRLQQLKSFQNSREKLITIKTFGHSRASRNKKMPHFAHFPRPGENDPFDGIFRIPTTGPHCSYKGFRKKLRPD